MSADPHLGESAELYALGALDRHERERVDDHVRRCAACAHTLGAAEATVAALDAAFVRQLAAPERLGARIAGSAQAFNVGGQPRTLPGRGRPAPGFLAAAAALLVVAGAGGGAFLEHAGNARQAVHDSAVLAAIATSHFNHVTFTPRESGVPVSKVLYARDGGWFYVVVDSAGCACRVTVRGPHGTRDAGPPQARGTTSTLFVRDPSRPNELDLVDTAGRVISAARLVYPR